MPKLYCIAVDRLRMRGLREMADQYLKRIGSTWRIREIEVKNSAHRDFLKRKREESLKLISKIPVQSFPIFLDEHGPTMDSVEFAQWMKKLLNVHHSLSFVIGGAYGLDSSTFPLDAQRLSLSPMTFPHEWARVLLYEQIYRALSILRGDPYHK